MTLVRRVIWKAAHHLGVRASRWAWDDQFRRGHWDRLEARSPGTIALVARYAKGGRVVELGCGTGSLARQLPTGSFSDFLGIDVSAVAIERARRECPSGCRFETVPMEEWQGTTGAAVILLEESLYYLAPADQRSLLARCYASLAPGGVVIVIACDGQKHADTLATAEGSGRVVERINRGRRAYLVLGRPHHPTSPGTSAN